VYCNVADNYGVAGDSGVASVSGNYGIAGDVVLLVIIVCVAGDYNVACFSGADLGAPFRNFSW